MHHCLWLPPYSYTQILRSTHSKFPYSETGTSYTFNNTTGSRCFRDIRCDLFTAFELFNLSVRPVCESVCVGRGEEEELGRVSHCGGGGEWEEGVPSQIITKDKKKKYMY